MLYRITGGVMVVYAFGCFITGSVPDLFDYSLAACCYFLSTFER